MINNDRQRYSSCKANWLVNRYVGYKFSRWSLSTTIVYRGRIWRLGVNNCVTKINSYDAEIGLDGISWRVKQDREGYLND